MLVRPNGRRVKRCCMNIMANVKVHLRTRRGNVNISLYLKAFKKNLVQIGKVVSEKIWFEFLYVHNLRQRLRNDLDLQYSHNFICSIR